MKAKLIKFNLLVLLLFSCFLLTGCNNNRYQMSVVHLQEHAPVGHSIIVREAYGFVLNGEYAFEFKYFEKIDDESTSLLKTEYVFIDKNDEIVCSKCEKIKGSVYETYLNFKQYGKQVIDYRDM